MRTIRTKVYKFNELSETAKEKAANWYFYFGNIAKGINIFEFLTKSDFEFYQDGTLYNPAKP